MPHPVDAYQASAATARETTIAKFGPDKWPVEPGTPEHTFWLERIDEEMAAGIQIPHDVTGDLDFPAPNHFDPSKRGFTPR